MSNNNLNSNEENIENNLNSNEEEIEDNLNSNEEDIESDDTEESEDIESDDTEETEDDDSEETEDTEDEDIESDDTEDTEDEDIESDDTEDEEEDESDEVTEEEEVVEEKSKNNVIEFVKKNVNNKNGEEPLYWVLPNKLYFPSWVSSTFSKYKLGKTTEKIVKGKFSPLKYQKFLKKFMQPVSPYRGMLLYHSLGSGKTCTAIGIAEQFKEQKNIVVLLPASLKDNFIRKGVLFCGDDDYKQSQNMYKKVYSFVSYNASNTPDQIKRLGNLDNKIIIIEEAHNLISRMVGGIEGTNKNGKFIYDALINAKNSRIIALTGTPIQKKQYELALLANVLRGKIEIHSFQINHIAPRYGSTPDLSELETALAEIEKVDYIDLNLTGKFIEVHLTINSYNKNFEDLINQIKNTCSDKGVKVYYEGKEDLTLFPEDPEEFDGEYIVSDHLGERLRDKQILEKRIMGLISYYYVSKEGFPDLIDKGYLRVPMSDYQRAYYQVLREKEKKGESKRPSSSKGESKSTFRVYTRQASNFVFPKDIPRPYKDKNFVVFKSKGNSNNNTEEEIENMNKEADIDEGNVDLDKEYKMRRAKAVSELVSRGSEYLVEGSEGLNKLSPKMLMILKNIKDAKGLIFIYSNFRSMEGVGIFAKVLEANGYSKYGSDDDKPKYGIYSGQEDQEERARLVDVFTSPENKYGKRVKIIMATAAGAEGLDLKNIRQVHVMDPYWYESRIDQVIGRAVRRNSHDELPEDERNVEVFRYLTVFPEHTKANAKRSKREMATDEYIDFNSKKKQKIIDEMLLAMKEAAVDCKLNRDQIEGDYKCLDFGDDVRSDELAYFARRSRDISHEIKDKSVEYKKAFIHTKTKEIFYLEGKKFMKFSNKTKKDVTNLVQNAKKEKNLKPIYIDVDNLSVFTEKSVKQDNPKQIGTINAKGKFTKLKK